MKKIILLIACIFLLTGCTQVKDLSYDDILETISGNANRTNMYRTGYKYYLPQGMEIEDSTLFNEVITDYNNVYYLYIDGISYHNKKDNSYKENGNVYYSKEINNDDKNGYVEINLLENEKYLIEIMYNYAKIEVIVEQKDINISLFNALNILKSVEYNDNIIANLLDNDVLNFVEEEFNIFHTTSSDSTYIQIDDSYQEEEQQVPDTDLIN